MVNLLLMAGIVLAIIFLIFFMQDAKKAYTCVVRSKDSNRVIRVAKMLPRQDKETKGIIWKNVWWQKTIKFPEPDDRVIATDIKGRPFVECHRLSKDEFLFIQPEPITNQSILTENNTQFISSFKPFGLVPRSFIISQFKRSEAERQKDLREFLINTFPWIILSILFVVVILNAEILFGNVNGVLDETGGLLSDIRETASAMGIGDTYQIVGGVSGGGELVTGSENPQGGG